jgi:hypothetical protein
MTRDQIIEAAKIMLGWKFQHQARGKNNSVDCVGFLVVLGQKLGYENIYDVEGYRRTPSADVIRQMLKLNADEIPVSEAQRGDIFLMRLFGRKPRHAALYFDDDSNPSIIHASKDGVRIQPLSDFPPAWFVAAFKIRGI